MHTKIHTATSVLCVHFQFSFHLDADVTRHALSTRKAFFLVYFQPPFWTNFGRILVHISHKIVSEKRFSFTLFPLSSRSRRSEEDKEDEKMFESCCGGARSENNGTKKVNITTTTEIDETTDGISLGNGWQRWVDFEERRYYYSKGGTTTWEAPSEEDLIEEENKTKGKK